MKDYFFLFSVIKIITISIENTVVQVRKDKKILSEITTKRNSDKDYYFQWYSSYRLYLSDRKYYYRSLELLSWIDDAHEDLLAKPPPHPVDQSWLTLLNFHRHRVYPFISFSTLCTRYVYRSPSRVYQFWAS